MALPIEPYEDVFKTFEKDVLGRSVSEGHPQDVDRTRPLELRVRPFRDLLIKSAGDVLKIPVGDVP